jgi:general secretion pathway protein D
MYKYLIIIFLLLVSFSLFGQAADDRQPMQEQETVTFLETTNFNDFLQILESFSWKYERKKIINLSSNNEPIGIPIHNLMWHKALELIALKNGLMVEDKAGVIYVKNREAGKPAGDTGVKLPPAPKDIDTKQVRISAVAFNCDRAYLKSLGIDWSTLLDGKVKANVDFLTSALVPTPVISAGGSRTTLYNGGTIEVNALLTAIESNQLGTIIARPTVVVSSGKKGYIQVGQDVSVKTVDDAGNTTDTFFQTGVIMDVIPTILKADSSDAEAVHLVASVERSSATPGAVSTVINKSKSTTDVILYDGEETVIGGLYDTDEVRVRSGIPILKDLPWWVFGIRYLTGYFKIDKKERELVFIIKADIIDNALTRQKNKH